MRKHTFLLILCFILSTLLLTACGEALDTTPDKIPTGPFEEGSQGLLYQFDSQGKYYTVIGIGSCTDQKIVIPATHAGYPVKAIAPGAFQVGGDGALSRQHGAFLLSLGDAFSSPDTSGGADKDGVLEKIESVEIPDSVTEIGDSAFEGCESLEDIEMSNLVNMIGTDAFKDTAFFNDPANWDNSVLYLQNHLVAVNDSFSGELTVKDGTKHIAASALKNCTALSGVRFPSTLASIGADAFLGCTALGEVDLSFAGIDIGARAFYGCTSLTSVKIADDTKPSALPQADLDKIAKLSFPESDGDVEFVDLTFSFSRNYFTYGGEDFVYSSVIGANAFAGCTALTDIELGKNLKAIGAFAFSECRALKTVSLENLTVVTDIRDAVVHTGGMTFEKTELRNLFSGCTALENVTLPDGIVTLNATFTDCTALKRITLPATVTTLRRTFEWCASLESVKLPEGLTTLTQAAFRGCIAMGNLTLPDSVGTIKDYALAGIPTTSVISIGKGVSEIGIGAFENCQSLTFRGTAAEWNAIQRSNGWFTNENNKITVHCVDGDVTE